MNKKILISLSIIGVVAALAVGGTIAYFSDTETSTGNTFTAGVLDLKIDNHCFYNGDNCYCSDMQNPQTCTWLTGPNQGQSCTCTWGLADLDGKVFFNFTDLKPGDQGEDTISVHVENNDAFACVKIKPTANDDVDCTEPEKQNDQNCSEPNNFLWDGELAQNLNFVFWADICNIPNQAYPGDNVYTKNCDEILMQGPASNILGGATFALADSKINNVGEGNGKPLTGGKTYYIGKAWCFGKLTTDPQISCDGKLVNNAAQTDTLKGNIEFYAVQARNNTGFTCQDKNLIGYWKFNEGEGNIAHDSSGYGNHGTIYGANWASPALSFDGIDDYVNIGNNSNLQITSAITLEAWIKTPSYWNKQYPTPVSKANYTFGYPGDWDGEYWIAIRSLDGRISFAFAPAGGNAIDHWSNGWLLPNTWYHIAATFDDSADKVKIYINGVLDKEFTEYQKPGVTNHPVRIGQGGNYPYQNSWFNGIIDEVRIYKRVLSASEILEHYQSGF